MTLKSNFKFYLTDKFNSGATTVTIGNDVETDSSVELSTATSILIRHPDKADVIERITATATGGTLTTTARGLSNANPGVAASSREKDWRPGAICYVTLFPEDILEKDANDTVPGDITFSGDVVFSGSERVPVYADATARDAAITSPVNGMEVYNTATGKFEDYTGGAWVDRESGGTFSNASTTVAGKKEDPTDAEAIAGTDVGGTGATMSPTPSQVAKNQQSGTFVYAGASAVGTDAYAVTMTPTLTAYTTGMKISFKADVANTGACTIDVDSLGVKNIKNLFGSIPNNGDIKANSIVELKYDGTDFIIQNTPENYDLNFGTGVDGNVTISGDTTLTADMNYENLTIDNTFTLYPDGYKIYVRGTLTNNGTIDRVGNAGSDGSGATGGAGAVVLNQGTLNDSIAGGAGGDGGNLGDDGTAGTASNPSYSNVNGSAGGSCTLGGAGGAGGTTTRGSAYNTVYNFYEALLAWMNPASSSVAAFAEAGGTQYKGPASSGGGGGGRRDTGTAGGGGGGGGAGGTIWIAAKILDNTTGVISSVGGAGGAGADGTGSGSGNEGGGGGGGGAGGVIYLIYKTLTAIGTTTVTGGAGGAGGTGNGTADDGGAGTAGSTGVVYQIAV